MATGEGAVLPPSLQALGSVPINTVELHRGSSGLGFNIKGGKDVPFIEGDPSIFICKIREKGAAITDGRLQEGDLILEINGIDITNVTHQDAVKHFINAHDIVKLKIIPGAERIIKERLGRERIRRHRNNRGTETRPAAAQERSISLFHILTGVVALGAIVAGTYIILNKRSTNQ